MKLIADLFLSRSKVFLRILATLRLCVKNWAFYSGLIHYFLVLERANRIAQCNPQLYSFLQ
jgi:hypothetical protein